MLLLHYQVDKQCRYRIVYDITMLAGSSSVRVAKPATATSLPSLPPLLVHRRRCHLVVTIVASSPLIVAAVVAVAVATTVVVAIVFVFIALQSQSRCCHFVMIVAIVLVWC